MTDTMEETPEIKLTPATPEQTLALLRCIARSQAHVAYARERANLLSHHGLKTTLHWIEAILMIDIDDPEHEPLKDFLTEEYHAELRDHRA